MTRQLVRPEPVVTVKYMREMRDEDRRRYKSNVILIAVLQIIIIAPLKFGVDITLAHSMFRDIQYLRPYTIVIPLILFVLIWALGIHVSFRRKY